MTLLATALAKTRGTGMTEVSEYDKEQELNQGPCILLSHPQTPGLAAGGQKDLWKVLKHKPKVINCINHQRS